MRWRCGWKYSGRPSLFLLSVIITIGSLRFRPRRDNWLSSAPQQGRTKTSRGKKGHSKLETTSSGEQWVLIRNLWARPFGSLARPSSDGYCCAALLLCGGDGHQFRFGIGLRQMAVRLFFHRLTFGASLHKLLPVQPTGMDHLRQEVLITVAVED